MLVTVTRVTTLNVIVFKSLNLHQIKYICSLISGDTQQYGSKSRTAAGGWDPCYWHGGDREYDAQPGKDGDHQSRQ